MNDQKFLLIARKSGASVAEVIAVWACLLEAASMSDVRGSFGAVDFEALDCALGMEDGKSASIHERMLERFMVSEDGRIQSWAKRQPKREREDDHSTGRVQAFRDKQRHETPSNASVGEETPRGEERREEEQEPPTLRVDPPEKLKKAKTIKTELPSDFGISERVSEWAATKGYDRLDEHLESFKRKVAANGYRRVSWDDSFMEAIREDWAKLRGSSARGVAPPAAPKAHVDAEATQRYLESRHMDPEEIRAAALRAKERRALQ